MTPLDPEADDGRVLSLGLIGGLSPESSLVYYRRLIELSREGLGGGHYPRMVLASVDFAPYVEWQHGDRWDRIAEGLGRELEGLASAGCDFAAIASNTMHKVLPDLPRPIPLLGLPDALADAARRRGWGTLGLTGTAFTMEDGFYARGLETHGLEVITPESADRSEVHRIIYRELVEGVTEERSVERFAGICRGLVEAGADAVLLGCTELAMLTRHPRWPAGMPALDSTEEHVHALWQTATGRPSPGRAWDPESRTAALRRQLVGA